MQNANQKTFEKMDGELTKVELTSPCRVLSIVPIISDRDVSMSSMQDCSVTSLGHIISTIPLILICNPTYFKRSCHPAVFDITRDSRETVPLRQVSRVCGKVSASCMSTSSRTIDTVLPSLDDSGSELYPAEGDGGRLRPTDGGR